MNTITISPFELRANQKKYLDYGRDHPCICKT